MTNGTKISKQSEDELMIVMRSIYLQFSKNVNTHIDKQVYELNKKVLKYCIKNVHDNIKQYKGYIRDITKEREVLENAKNVDIKGENFDAFNILFKLIVDSLKLYFKIFDNKNDINNNET